jgi:hypothetical protein
MCCVAPPVIHVIQYARADRHHTRAHTHTVISGHRPPKRLNLPAQCTATALNQTSVAPLCPVFTHTAAVLRVRAVLLSFESAAT